MLPLRNKHSPQVLRCDAAMRSQGRGRLPSIHGMQTRRSQQGESPPSWQMIGASKSANYNQQMQKQMGWSDPYQYYPDRGLYYHEVAPNLFCGSQPQSPDDIQRLRQNVGIGTVVNLQQDKDFAYWNVDHGAHQHRASEIGLNIIRCPAQDFDPDSLRAIIPSAVRSVQQALGRGEKVYVHCTAGLGRAPGVCIAHIFWFQEKTLDEAYNHLTSIRPCGPKRESIRGATFDVLRGGTGENLIHLPPNAFDNVSRDERAEIQRRILA
ncbi:hypothetical protein WJX84_005267 [Apatococcus fuscideae]|uniref:Uncharacterized protein n=1 Tax=Apatococcus fuscideae TaxID=2026836 RepID=A0AAW1S105_9CHLO